VAPLSREVGEGLPEVREFWWDLLLGRDRGVGAGYTQLAARSLIKGRLRSLMQASHHLSEAQRGREVRQPVQAVAGHSNPVQETGGQLPGDGSHSGANYLAILVNHQTRPRGALVSGWCQPSRFHVIDIQNTCKTAISRSSTPYQQVILRSPKYESAYQPVRYSTSLSSGLS
jgi:hypothetical protein